MCFVIINAEVIPRLAGLPRFWEASLGRSDRERGEIARICAAWVSQIVVRGRFPLLLFGRGTG